MTTDTLDGFVVERAQPGQSLIYDGRAGPLAGIAITNTLLSLVTLGIYRFWGKTRLRRYLWSRITFEDDRLEYVGKGSELLYGFCIALLILLPLSALSVLGELLFVDKPMAYAVYALLQALFILWLIQVAIFRARRYRLSRTKWRGIRAGQTGSAVHYAFLYWGWMLLASLTGFLAVPWARTALQRYRVTHSWFGNQAFTFKSHARPLFIPWLLVWAPFFFGFAILLLFGLSQELTNNKAPEWVSLMGPGFLILGAVMLLRYRVVEFRYFASCTRFGRCHFTSRLRSYVVFLIYLAAAIAGLALVVLVSFGLLTVLGVSVAQLSGEMTQWLLNSENLAAGQATVMLVILAWMVVVAACLSLVRVVVVLHLMTRFVTSSLTVTDPAEFEAAVRSRKAAPKVGEGLADALDVGEIGF